MSYTFLDLPFEILLLIAETNHNVFATLRLINKDIRDYTNTHMNKYKSIFSREITTKRNPHNLLDIITKCYILPNGHKHGPFEELYLFYGCSSTTGIYLSKKIYTKCTYKDDRVHKLLEKYNTHHNYKRIMYDNGIKSGLYEKYCYGVLSEKRLYKNGEVVEQLEIDNTTIDLDVIKSRIKYLKSLT
jgi:hypothetical protein